MRIGLITTLNTNMGDDFVREGISLILGEVFKGQPLEFIAVNKHRPFTVYPERHLLRQAQRLGRLLPRGKVRLQRWAAKAVYRFDGSLFDSCEIIVQCGAPVIWPGCSQCEWAEPLWHQVVGRLSRKGVPVLNLGAGSCFPWERQPGNVNDEKDALYLRRILSYCRITTARDRLAQHFFEDLGSFSPLIPCPGLLAGKPFLRHESNKDLAIISYMAGGGHYDLGQKIDPQEWRDIIKIIIERVGKQHRILFLCHNQKEYELAADLEPTIARFLPKDSKEYFSVLSRAKFGLCNRLHAVIALAGIGIPSVGVGTDTRLLMVDAVGLPSLYVKEATAERIEETLRHLSINWSREHERLLMLREQTWKEYIEVVKKALSL